METPKGTSTLSPARLAACRANARKMQAGSVAKFRMTEKRLAACRVNIRKAHEANRTKPLSPARQAALKKAQEANRRNFRLTPARLAAMRANGRKMQAGSVAKFGMTEKRRAACRENIKKAQAAWRISEKRQRPSYNDLKHGAYARHVLETLRRLGEDPQAYEALHAILARLLAPQNEKEKALVRQLGDLVWQRRRVPRAAVRWEEEQLRNMAGSAPMPENLSPYETRDRAMALWETLFNDAQRFERMDFFQSRIETQLRKLLRLRSEGQPEIWKAVKNFKPDYWQEYEQRLPNIASALEQALKKPPAPDADEEAEDLSDEIWPGE
jgi:hypothetical protein